MSLLGSSSQVVRDAPAEHASIERVRFVLFNVEPRTIYEEARDRVVEDASG